MADFAGDPTVDTGAEPAPFGTRLSALPFRTSVLLALHVPLGIAMHQSPTVATVHAAVTLLVAIIVAFGPSVDRMVYVAAYFCGSEVLWKMNHASSPWEFGKYGVILVFTIALIRQRPFRIHWPSFAFILLLLPSAVLTLTGLELKEAQGQISFNLAGPIALALATWLMASFDLDARAQRRVVIALAAPLVSIVTVTAFITYVVGGVKFGTESNFEASGGFGPNQVSAILAFGALSTFLSSFDRAAGIGYRTIMLVLTVVFTIQSAMTFSRGGLLVTSLAAAAALWYLVNDRRSRVRLLLITAAVALGSIYVVIPRLDDFTGGALSKRFGDHSLTRRDDIIKDDIDIWLANPVMGTGPGMAKVQRLRSNNGHAPMASHTEFSRLLAEHGLFGLAAMLVLFLICVHGWQRAATPLGKASATAYIAWGMLFMVQSGTRIVAPSLAFGLAYGMGRGILARRRAVEAAPQWMSSARLLWSRQEARARSLASRAEVATSAASGQKAST